MSRWYTRAQQRKYKEERRVQAARVADRLLGKKKTAWPPSYDDVVDAMKYYNLSTNFYVASPRMSSIITGLNGV